MAASGHSWLAKATGSVSQVQGKMGEGKISSEAIAMMLANCGKPIFAEMGLAKVRRDIFAISRVSSRSARIGNCGAIFTVLSAAHITHAAYDSG
ncbi:MAG: hypothetical protein HY323_11710 [Betaproteobacteria bacterium]|nr:hypothetical protein [Betaproteobacteria bacterium]